jgi:hypothetical protein
MICWQYWDRDEKLKFMDQHGIDISFVRYLCFPLNPNKLSDVSGSSANPWLDFLPFSEAQALAQQLNADLESYCATGPSVASALEFKRFYGFGLLPLVPGAPAPSLPEAVSQLASQHRHIRGVIIGTRGAGLGLDDPALEPLWAALAETGLVVFLHPHYGIGAQEWGPHDNGHVLPLALGFPFETTTVCALHLSRHNDVPPYTSHRQSCVSFWRAFSIATQTCAFSLRTQGVRYPNCHHVSRRASSMIPSWQAGLPTTHGGILAGCGLMRSRTGLPS